MTDVDSRRNGKGRTGSIIYLLFGIVVVSIALLLSVRLRAERRENIQNQTREREANIKAGPKVRRSEAL